MNAPPPSKIFAVHLNYRSRAEQRGRIPDVPSYFLKPPSSIARDGDPIVRPLGTELLSFEGEIAVIIGERARAVTPEEAPRYIGWYAPANDVGLHDLRWADRGSNVLSKGHDGFTPIGEPVEASTVDPQALVLRTRVNGEIVQEDGVPNLLFPFGLLIADLSRFMTLEVGDVILTGTPAGSREIGPGDVVEVEVEGVGRVRNPVVAATAPIARFGAQPRVTADARAAATGSPVERAAPALDDETKAALRTVATATLTVQLAAHGIRDTAMRGLRSTRPGMRLLGTAYTLRYLPLREDVRDADTAELNAQKLAIESIGPDEVLVIDARGEPGAGTIGDILAARALARGATGIVTDGGLRDSAAVAELEIPTYYQCAHPAVLGLAHYPLESNVPIACGGALVLPGDVIVGDDDGVVVIPFALAQTVARAALAQEAREEWAMERVRAGESIRGIFPLSAARTEEFERWRETHGSPGGHDTR